MLVQLKAGDILYLRDGVYVQQTMRISANGTQSQPIIVQSYPEEIAVFDGQGTIPSSPGSYTVMVFGDWVTVKNFTIESSGNGGVVATGNHVTVENLDILHAQGAGIILSGDYTLAYNNHINNCGLINENNKNWKAGGGWPAVLSCCRYPIHCTIKKNIVANSWGEGISTFEAAYTTLEDNISYNNQQNFYLSDTKFSIFQRNLSYCTPGNPIAPYHTQNGLLVGDEKGLPVDINGDFVNPADPNYHTRATSSDNTVINNFIIGCDRNLAAGTKVSNNSLYANNTFVNSDEDPAQSEKANVLIYTNGSCTNCRFINNVTLQENNVPITIGGGVNNGWTFSHNLWSKNPGSNFTGANDLADNPLLAKIDTWPPKPVTAGSFYPFNGYYFKLTDSSPAINQALVLAEVTDDYFNNHRNSSPDRGGHELSTNQASPTPQPCPADLNEDGEVNFEDFKQVLALWGQNYSGNEDLKPDGKINALDLAVVIKD